jgi:signal transduction histidine kinase
MNLPIGVVGTDISPRPHRLVEGALYRIAQEAVINAARHAHAREIRIEVTASQACVRLTVADDGIGFDPAAPTDGPDHWGVKNMRERARAVGGRLMVDSAPGRGTRIKAEVPGAVA